MFAVISLKMPCHGTKLNVPTGSSTMEHLFVYGTLMSRNEQPHPLLRSAARLLGPASIAGELYDLGPYPALRLGAGLTSPVRGELYSIAAGSAEQLLSLVDRYEGADASNEAARLYQRVRVVAQFGQRDMEAWTYEYARPLRGARRITSGDYRQQG